jgi:hypothetical protein
MSFSLVLTVSLVCLEPDEIVSFSTRLCSNSKGSRKSLYLSLYILPFCRNRFFEISQSFAWMVKNHLTGINDCFVDATPRRNNFLSWSFSCCERFREFSRSESPLRWIRSRDDTSSDKFKDKVDDKSESSLIFVHFVKISSVSSFLWHWR